MQSIFALHTSRDAEYNITLNEVKDKFLPDLNSMEEQDKEKLAEQRKEAGPAFVKAFNEGIESIDSNLDEVIKEAVSDGITSYENQINNLRLTYKKRLIADTKNIFNNYLSLLMLPIELRHILKVSLKVGQSSNFITNSIVNSLARSKSLESLCLKKSVSWQNEQNTLRGWVKEIIRKDESFQEYEGLEHPTFEDHHNFLLYFFKTLVFKNETISAYFESIDLGWSENGAVLKSMVLKTIKSMEEEEDEPVLMELSKNWDEDLLFLEKIFDLTLKEENEYAEIVADRSKNWEIDRVAMTDKIILEMALAEMINFPSIPVKVTINEYIELSKLYSTPKSKQFINGILDVLSQELKKEGRIKKSGRGLLDNK